MSRFLLFGACLLPFLANAVSGSVLVNGGFESVEPIGTFWPDQYGDWNGDGGTVVTAENGISPLEGNRMLRFDYGAPSSFGATNLGASQVEQLVDASLFGDVSSGIVKIQASAWFNRIAGDSQTDTEFSIALTARSGNPINYPADKESEPGGLAFAITTFLSDSDVSTWEKASVHLVLPSNTDFVSIQVVAVENVFNDFSGVEFDGHYADNVVLNRAVPEPSTVAIWTVFGVVGLSISRRRLQRYVA